MDQLFNFLLAMITVLMATTGYFLKKTFDKIGKVSDDVSDIKPKVDILWKDRLAPATSPRQLNERGQIILNESGIKEIIDKKYDKLLELAKTNAPTNPNPYDAEQAVFKLIEDMPERFPDIIDELKSGAFKSGEDVPAILFVGGIYFRDKIFPALGFQNVI